MGNVLTAFVALAVIPLIMPMVMALRSADMVFIILLGITFIGVLATGSMVKGLLSGGIGLMISFIGFQPATGAERFIFGSPYLYDGIGLIPLLLGLFAIPEMVALATRGGTIARTQAVIKGTADVWRGVMDVFRHKLLVMRSQFIGFIAGAIPGVGASPATFIAYGQAKTTSKHPETFGQVTNVTLITDKFTGRSKGFGFVEMASDTEGQAGSAALRTHLRDPRSVLPRRLRRNVVAAQPDERSLRPGTRGVGRAHELRPVRAHLQHPRSSRQVPRRASRVFHAERGG